jgi:hypothetical protein
MRDRLVAFSYRLRALALAPYPQSADCWVNATWPEMGWDVGWHKANKRRTKFWFPRINSSCSSTVKTVQPLSYDSAHFYCSVKSSALMYISHLFYKKTVYAYVRSFLPYLEYVPPRSHTYTCKVPRDHCTSVSIKFQGQRDSFGTRLLCQNWQAIYVMLPAKTYHEIGDLCMMGFKCRWTIHCPTGTLRYSANLSFIHDPVEVKLKMRDTSLSIHGYRPSPIFRSLFVSICSA